MSSPPNASVGAPRKGHDDDCALCARGLVAHCHGMRPACLRAVPRALQIGVARMRRRRFFSDRRVRIAIDVGLGLLAAWAKSKAGLS